MFIRHSYQSIPVSSLISSPSQSSLSNKGGFNSLWSTSSCKNSRKDIWKIPSLAAKYLPTVVFPELFPPRIKNLKGGSYKIYDTYDGITIKTYPNGSSQGYVEIRIGIKFIPSILCTETIKFFSISERKIKQNKKKIGITFVTIIKYFCYGYKNPLWTAYFIVISLLPGHRTSLSFKATGQNWPVSPHGLFIRDASSLIVFSPSSSS